MITVLILDVFKFWTYRLRAGWSVKTNQFNQYPKPQPLTEKEQQAIVSVIQKAEELELNEQHRVG